MVSFSFFVLFVSTIWLKATMLDICDKEEDWVISIITISVNCSLLVYLVGYLYILGYI